MAKSKEPSVPRFGKVTSAAEIGALYRAARKQRGLTLEDIYEATALSTRFLSEFERGKQPNASLDRVLRAFEALGIDLLVFDRSAAQRILRRYSDDPAENVTATRKVRTTRE